MSVHLYYAPSFDDQVLYIPLSNGDLVAVDKSNLKVIWTFKGSGPAAEAPLVTPSYVYFTTLAHQFYILDKTDGHPLQTIRLRGRARSKPYIKQNQLYVVYEDKYVGTFIQEE